MRSAITPALSFVLAASACTNPYASPACADRLDNDRDGLADELDPGCQGPGDDDESDDGIDSGTLDAGLDAQVDGAADAGTDGGATCLPGAAPWLVCERQRVGRSCGGSCVDVTNDPQHCGQCNQACEAAEACLYGRCQSCSVLGGVLCGGRCTRPEFDPRACGSCGGPECGPNQACRNGSCALAPLGSACSRPVELTSGRQAVPVVPAAVLAAPFAPCAVTAAPIRGAILALDIPPGTNDVEVTATVPGATTFVALQGLSDACTCSVPAYCASGTSSARLVGRLAVARAVIGVTTGAPVDTIDVDVLIR